MTKKYVSLLLFLVFSNVFSQVKDSINNTVQQFKIDENTTYGFTKPTTWDMFRYIPRDIASIGTFAVQKENLKWDALALGSTLAIMPYDQKIMNDANKLGADIGGWDKDSRYKRVLGLEMFPTSVSSGVYYLGNGNTTLLLSGMFYAIGKIGKVDYRAINTSNELIEVLFSVGVSTQTIKRITGRQSPVAAIKSGVDGGEWNPFPSFTAYQKTTPNYDAMPSGHMATYIATLTVIATNYPEIKWIKPVGYSLGTLLAFNMVSGRVHWTSDYPIAVFMGYVMGKTIANRRIIKKETALNTGTKKTTFKTNYSFNRLNNMNLIGATITF
ncbi:phosphatase PAP2 family protein [Flavobacterium aciduliphilum]|nr:phosphatase PAP2 family protein [Flavobacterium aciduliphilum]